MSNLEPLDPATGVEMYLDSRRQEISDQTYQSHRYRLKAFLAWCDEVGIDDLNDLGGRDLHRFKIHRRDVDDLKPVTLQGQLSTLRQFVRFCETIDAVQPGLHEKIMLPSTSAEEDSRDSLIEPDHAEAVLEYLDQFEYASRDHAIFALAWEISCRTGGLRAPDLDDVDVENRALAIRHRPESDTPLKNGTAGERDVSLSPELTKVLDDYVSYRRIDAVDEYGREPLFTTQHGRISRGSVRNTFYRVTRPCVIGQPCPHDRNPADCEAMEHSYESLCPSSVPPHDVRRGSITEYRGRDVDADLVSERVDATEEVIERHYDQRSHRERMEKRRRQLENAEHSKE